MCWPSLFRRCSCLASDDCYFIVCFNGELRFGVANQVDLSRACGVEGEVVRSVARFAYDIALRPVLAVPTSVGIMFVSDTDRVLLLYEDVARANCFRFFARVGRRKDWDFNFPGDFLFSVSNYNYVRTRYFPAVRQSVARNCFRHFVGR